MSDQKSVSEVLKIVKKGDFRQLIGLIENDFIECKGAPYILSESKEKFELSKDVTGFANSIGGIILIGVATVKKTDQPYEQIDSIRSFRKEIIDLDQYDNILAAWIYPRLTVEIDWVPASENDQIGLAYIFVPNQPEEKKPYFVSKIITDDGKSVGNNIGFFQRKRSKIDHYSIAELHHIFKDGMRFDTYLSQFFESGGISRKLPKRRSQDHDIEEKISSRLPERKSQDHDIEEKIPARLQSAIKAVALECSTTFSLIAFPNSTVELIGLFEKRNSPMSKLVDQPHELRYGGFDINTGSISRIINGETRRAVTKDFMLLEAWRDGTILFVASGGNGYLCWGNNSKKEFYKLNPICLIESVYLFVLHVRQLYKLSNITTQSLKFQLLIDNIPVDNKYGLTGGVVGSVSWMLNDLAFANTSEISIKKDVIEKDLIPEIVAYELVREVYVGFGFEYEYVPYTKVENDIVMVDVELIKNIK